MAPKPPSKSHSQAPAKAASSSRTHRLTLKGSAKLIAEFFEYSINSILFQRGVYPPEDFTAVKKYGLNMLVTADDQVKAYIKRIMGQLNRWMLGGKISKLVVVITDKDSGEVVERWQFDVSLFSTAPKPPSRKGPSESDPATPDGENGGATAASTTAGEVPPDSKTEKQVQDEIQAIFRQITASVTFLPVLDGNCTFNVLVYADADSEVPVEWGDSDAREIEGGERVQLRSFSTSNHRVDTLVSYRWV
ncbi:Mitotic spindle checkpoint component mad2 [Ascosphaera acerosa]|nr:Mitotic spindle checkpoint component mad2 [Ascosphaera acerosa]